MIQKSNSKKTLRKRLIVSALVLFTLYLCFGIWGVPAIIKSQIQRKGSEAIGRAVSLEKASFNPLSFETKLYELGVGPEEGGGDALAMIGMLSVNPQLFASLFGAITLKSIEVEDAEFWVEKGINGRMSFQDILDLQAAQPTEEEESGELPAVIVKSLDLDDLDLHFTDSSLATPFQETIILDRFQGVDLGTVEKSGIGEADTDALYHWSFEAEIESEGGAEVTLEGGAKSIFPWSLEVELDLEEFDLATLQPYVDEAVLAQLKGVLGLDAVANATFAEGGARILLESEMELEGFAVADEESEFAAFERFRIEGLKLDASSMNLTIEEIELQKPVFSAVLLESGSLLMPKMKGARASSPAVESEENPLEFEAKISSIRILDGSISVEDRMIETPFSTSIDSLEVALSDVTASQGVSDYDASGKLELNADLLGGSLEFVSMIESLAGEVTASVSLEGLELSPLQNYLAEYSNAALQSGAVSLDLEARGVGLAPPSVTGEFGLADLRVTEKGSERSLVAMKQLLVEGIDFENEAITLGLVRLENPDLTIWQNEQGMNLNRIIKIEQKAEQAIEGVERETGVAVTIDRFEMVDGGVDFVDTSLVSTHQSRVSEFDLTVNSISTDPKQIADFVFNGTVDGSAKLAGDGKLNVSDPKLYMDLDMEFEGYDLLAASPYAETYLGRDLTKGLFLVRSNYQVRESKLTGVNQLKIDQLTFGEKVESDRAISIPLGLAMALMKGPNGIIEPYPIEINGDLDNPDVRIGPLIGQACMNLILNAVASPFKFLARMAGGREDVDTIEFEVGVVALGEDGKEKVATLQKFLKERPGLKFEVAFKPDPAERVYLENQHLRHLLANPDFQVASGVDLLAAVDQEALEANVRERYLALQAIAPAEEQAPVAPSAQTDAVIEPPVSEDKKTEGVVGRLATILRLKKKEDTAEDPQGLSVSESSNAAAEPETAEQVLPPFEEMLELVASSHEKVSFDIEWLDDLASERIRSFKEALFEDGGIENSRVYATELSPEDEQKPAGALVLKQAE